MAYVYGFVNGVSVAAVLVPVATGVATIKTMLQVKMSSPHAGKVIEWGFSADAAAAAVPGSVELIETAAVFATVTAFAAGDICKWSDPNAPVQTEYFDVGTAASGFTASAEGTVAATRIFESQQMPPTGFYSKQFPLGREPLLTTANSLRIRTKFAADVNITCYVLIEV